MMPPLLSFLRRGLLPWAPMFLALLLCLLVGEATASESAGGLEGGDEEIEPAYAVLFPWFVQAVGIVVYFLLTRYLHFLPYTAVLFLVGTIMGVGAEQSGFHDQLTESIEIWTRINHEVIFLVFLPGLLFKDAFEINFHLFQASSGQLLIMAFPMVLAGTVLTACVGFYVFPYDWSFRLALTFGSILAATDPVAVSALLNEVGAPPRLKMHISGESLLNDGSAVVFYTLFSGLFLAELGIDGLGEELTFGEGVAIFCRMAIGGFTVGVAYALGLIYILYKLDRRLEHEETVLQVAATVTTAYLSFYTSEIVCKMSGVIAVVVCGILTKAFGSGLISDWGVMTSFWGLLEHLLNTLIFALAGVVFGTVVSSDDRNWGASDWGYLILLYVLVTIIRFGLIFAFYPIISRIGLKSSWQEAVFSSWGGLRGAVGLALALGLDAEVFAETDDPAIRELTSNLFGMVGGIAFLTLSINGSLAGPLLAKLGLADSTESRKRIIECAEDATRRRMLDDFIHLMSDPRFLFVDFALVVHHCPRLRNLSARELTQAVKQNREDTHPSLYKPPNLEHVLPYIPDSGPLKSTFEKAKRDMFMGPASFVSPVNGFFQTEDLYDIDEDLPVAEEAGRPSQASSLLVKDIRVMFIELLRASYQGQIRDGELDPREYDGFLSYSLLQSVEFAHDAVMKGEPLNDWASSQMVSTEFVDRFETFAKKLYDCGCSRKSAGGPQQRLDTLRNSKPLRYQHLRLDVLRAFSFIDAHEEAQDRLRDEFGAGEGEIASAFRIVMNESKSEVRKANDVLKRQNKKDLSHVISHYLCIIIQNKVARYIKLLTDTGVLLPREARHYLEETEEHIRNIRHCRLDKHPGSIEQPDIEDLKVQRPRRKRVKQKSIL